MYNRYTQHKREGPPLTHAEQELSLKLTQKRKERRKRNNDELAERATKRVEEWMATTANSPGNEHEDEVNIASFEFRTREKSMELDHDPGRHWITANRYKKQSQRVREAEDANEARSAFRAEWQEQRFGESPFRRRVRSEELHPPLRFKDVTEAERINATTTSATTSLGCSADPLKEPQMGFDHIPVGMRPDTVCVRAKAKCSGPLQFTQNFRGGRSLNPADVYMTQLYQNYPEQTSYGFTKHNNLRPPNRSKQIDQEKIYLSTVMGAPPIIGNFASKRKDRMAPRVIDHPVKSQYASARTVPVLSVDNAEEVVQSHPDGQPMTSVEMATKILKAHGINKPRYLEASTTCANGSNIYGWNELFKYKDHIMK